MELTPNPTFSTPLDIVEIFFTYRGETPSDSHNADQIEVARP